MRILRSDLISLWWVSWFGIFGGFLSVGCWECKRELDQAGAALPFSIGLLLFIVIAWAAFLVADSKTAKPEPQHVNLLTLMGSLNASFTLIGILFFVYIAPRVR